jgi:LmbE family N-acetylglucosaminyl deacetylase
MKDEDFIELRRQEQRAAAKMAGYRGVLQFSYASSEIRRSTNPKLVEDLKRVFQAGNFNTVFTHSPFDRHATHRALSVHVLRAIQELPKRIQPKRVIGCEVWRSLDWLPSKMRKSFSILSTKAQMKELFSLYQSQIAGTKNYPEAVIGRKRSNATFSDSHAVDFAEFAEIGIDLSSVAHGKVSLAKFVGELLKAFQTEIQNELKPYLEKSNGNHHRKKSGSRIKVRSKNRR